MSSDIEQKVKESNNEIEKKFEKIKRRVIKLAEQKSELIGCLHTVKNKISKSEVSVREIQKIIDTTLVRIERGG